MISEIKQVADSQRYLLTYILIWAGYVESQ